MLHYKQTWQVGEPRVAGSVGEKKLLRNNWHNHELEATPGYVSSLNSIHINLPVKCNYLVIEGVVVHFNPWK